ncbi:MAG: ATP-binding cassette domain-containing protein, partial [Gammaproteobacteria bacterium]|nr:ATP-binding cassette domain-containing protein [Gammaproteobacteria bacterium]
MSEKLLEVKDLLIEADIDGVWTPIVNSLSMTLERGEILGLIGESGAGKSTFGLTALGYAKPGCRIVSGSIKLDGVELVGRPDAELRDIRGNKVAYVAQSAAASFNPAHTLEEQFAESPVQHGKMKMAEARARSIEIFRQLDLPDPEHIGDRYPHQVSGGQ